MAESRARNSLTGMAVVGATPTTPKLTPVAAPAVSGATPKPAAGDARSDRRAGAPKGARARRATDTREPHDGWTFVLIPPGTNARPRTLRISVRRLRFAIASLVALAGTTAGVGALLALLLSVTPIAREEAEGVRLGVLVSDAPAATVPVAGAPTIGGAGADSLAVVAPAGAPATAPSASAAAAPAAKPSNAASASPATTAKATRPEAARPVARVRARSAVSRVESAEAERERHEVIATLPVIGRITSRWAQARRHPVLGVVRRHKGLDIAAPSGTRITAPASGRVIFSGTRFGFGRTVEIEHGNGVVTRYAHCRSLEVKVGDEVLPGQVIATVGASGLATGPHLHYEILVHGRNRDPLRTSLRTLIPDRVAVPAAEAVPAAVAVPTAPAVPGEPEQQEVGAPPPQARGGEERIGGR